MDVWGFQVSILNFRGVPFPESVENFHDSCDEQTPTPEKPSLPMLRREIVPHFVDSYLPPTYQTHPEIRGGFFSQVYQMSWFQGAVKKKKLTQKKTNKCSKPLGQCFLAEKIIMIISQKPLQSTPVPYLFGCIANSKNYTLQGTVNDHISHPLEVRVEKNRLKVVSTTLSGVFCDRSQELYLQKWLIFIT